MVFASGLVIGPAKPEQRKKKAKGAEQPAAEPRATERAASDVKGNLQVQHRDCDEPPSRIPYPP